MPRKAIKTERPALLFLERSLCGARLQNVPEVRAALNPKAFFAETQEHSSSALTSWVSPQFDSAVAAAPPVRRGRRKCPPATSLLDSCSQLSRKKNMCKFPSLTFRTRSRGLSHPPKNARTQKATECAVVSNVGNRPQASRQVRRPVLGAQHADTPKRPTTSVRKGNVARFSDGSASCSGGLEQPETPSIQVTGRSRIPADGASAPACNEFSTTEVSSVGPPPDVDTPKAMQDGNGCPSSTSPHLLLPQPCTPPCDHLTPDILVADTPERDYGLKVTWRRRRALMLLLKERGHLSDSDVLIHS